MVSQCPKCGRKLTLRDLKPQCPGCKTNLLYYKIEERLEVDALNAEIEHAHTQKKMDRAKAAMVGSPLAIVRIVLLVLVIAAFMLPLAKLSAQGPFFESSTTYSAVQIVNSLMELDFGILSLVSSSVFGSSTLYLALSIVCVVLAALMALIELIVSFLSCSPKGFGRNVTLSVLGIIFSVAASVLFNMFLKSMTAILPGFATGSVGFGIYVVAGMFALVLLINIIIKARGGIKVDYKPCYIGKDHMLYEDFVKEYGVDRVTLDMVVEHADKFMKSKPEESQEVKEEAKA